jgi:hypothetical protein
MFFTGLDISSTNNFDAIYLASEKRRNPVLSKKTIAPISMRISDTIVLEKEKSINFNYTTNITSISSIPKALTSDEELTLMCMHVSEQSLKDGWENEDDAYWESFLKN